MLSPSDLPHQHSFFDATQRHFLDQHDPLVKLADVMSWKLIEDDLSQYRDNGRPALPIRLMAGLLILKQLENHQ